MTHERITADTPLFIIKIADPREHRFFYVAMRKDESPHDYDWRSLLTQWDGRDNAENAEERERWNKMYEQGCFKDAAEAWAAELRVYNVSEQRYEQDFLERECFTAAEAVVIEAHVHMLGYQVERKPVVFPISKVAASDTCGNAWQYRDFWEEGAVPCRLRYWGYFGVETGRVRGLLPDDYFDASATISLAREGEIQVKMRPPLFETEDV